MADDTVPSVTVDAYGLQRFTEAALASSGLDEAPVAAAAAGDDVEFPLPRAVAYVIGYVVSHDVLRCTRSPALKPAGGRPPARRQ